MVPRKTGSKTARITCFGQAHIASRRNRWNLGASPLDGLIHGQVVAQGLKAVLAKLSDDTRLVKRVQVGSPLVRESTALRRVCVRHHGATRRPALPATSRILESVVTIASARTASADAT